MATKAEKVAVYERKIKAHKERLGILAAKTEAAKRVIALCEKKVREAADDEPIVIPETPKKK